MQGMREMTLKLHLEISELKVIQLMLTPAYSEDLVRISMFGDEVEKITILDHVSLKEKKKMFQMKIYPAKHYLIAKDVRKKAVKSIRDELKTSFT